MSQNIILAPSQYTGYTPAEQSSKIKTWRKIESVWLVLSLILTAGFCILVGLETDWASAIFLGLLCLGVTVGLPSWFFDWRIGRLKRKHDHGMMNLIVENIKNNFSPNASWWFCPLSSQSECFFITDGASGIVNLDTDWALYIRPSNILSVSYEARNLGSTSHTKISGNTYGYGAGGVFAHTRGKAETQTHQHYSHIVDIYTNIDRYNHISLSFGGNESWAKQAYAKIQDVLSRAS